MKVRLIVAGAALLGGISCAPIRPLNLDSSDTEPCQTAADCEITDFSGCCACPQEPRAVNRSALAERTDVCTVVDCKCVGNCTCPRVADPRAFAPVCTHERCEMIRR